MAINGTIRLREGTVIEISDDNIVRGSLKITRSMSTAGKYDVGTFNAATLDLAIYDDDALLHDFGDAEVRLWNDGGNIGYFNVIAEKTKRRGTTVTLRAYDRATWFDVAVPSGARENDYSAADILNFSLSAARVSMSSRTGQIYSQLPNKTETVNLKSPQIQTWRDAVMWVCQLICCNATIDENGQLELVKARYIESGGSIVDDRVITADDRVSITFSDTRTHIKYLSAYKDRDNKLNYEYSRTITDNQCRSGEFALPYNPIIEDAGAANTAWLNYIGSFAQREIRAILIGEPNIRLGDSCRFSGGKVDVRNSIVGLVTDITRTYHGNTVVVCHAPSAVGGES